MNATPAKPRVATVVMSFEAPVAGPEGVRRVADELVRGRQRGRGVVGVVSALSGTTDRLRELAARVSPSPSQRELAMLLSTGERTACALVAMAIHDLGHEAVSFTGSQAGVLTDEAHVDATVREITPIRIVEALAAGKIALVAGQQGFSRDTMDLTTLGPGGTSAVGVALAEALGATHESR